MKVLLSTIEATNVFDATVDLLLKSDRYFGRNTSSINPSRDFNLTYIWYEMHLTAYVAHVESYLGP